MTVEHGVTVTPMKLTFIRKTRLSGDTNCPSLYVVDDGSFVVVGRLVSDDAEVRAQLPYLLPGEVAVHVPRDVLVD